MGNKNLGLMQENFEVLSKDELILALQNARLETFKYVNKFLEAEEKWVFINVLLKKLNSIKQKRELCQTICDGFLKLTNSKISYCALFNQDNTAIEFSKISYGKDSVDKRKLMKFINEVNADCCSFLAKSNEIEDIFQYFTTRSDKHLIIVPIIYAKIFFGYLFLIKDDDNFYKENSHFISIFPEHIALILENISLYQESEKSNKRKIEFLASISHEFKTPLNSIIGFAEIIQSKIKDVNKFKDKLDADLLSRQLENYRCIENILKSSKHLLSLIEDVLDVSRTQYNSLDLNYSMFSSKDEIMQVINTLEQMINEKNISVTYTLSEINIIADKKRFIQLIYNLVSNAIKFNKQNGKINILTYVDNNKFFFEITDTGDGISKRNYEKIFDFFSQVNRSQLKRQLGSGVGLAICKMITDAHGGEINFQSKLKKGSSFWFSLPMR